MNNQNYFPLPSFSGMNNESFEKYKYKMDARQIIEEWTEKDSIRYLISSLEEPALRTVMETIPENRTSYKKIMNLLHDAYAPKSTTLEVMQKLMSLKQKQEQTLIEYSKYFLSLVQIQTVKFPEEILVELFRKSLYKIEDGFAVLDGKAKTLSEAIDIASRREFTEDLKKKEIEIAKKNGDQYFNHDMNVDELALELKKLQIQFMEAERKRTVSKEKLCIQCNKVGHYRSYCPEIECYHCRVKGHIATKCPNREIPRESAPSAKVSATSSIKSGN